jgi:predicted transposase YbfD/YdcC
MLCKEAKNPLHLVSAWSEANQLVLGAVRTASKGNEITSIKELLDVLVLSKGDVITIDAIGCQIDIAKKIHGADYLLAVKQNQPKLADELANFFDQATQAVEYAPVAMHRIQRAERGRDDIQETWVTEDIEWLPKKSQWAGLSSLIMIYRQWIEKGKSHEEKRYYICSCRADPECFAHLT